MQIKPMLANVGDIADLVAYCEDDNYWLEQKLDGHRIVLDFSGGTITAKERNGNVSQHNSKFQTDEWEAVATKMDRDFILDGEWMSGEYWVFDMPYCASVVSFDSPYDVRRAVLETVGHNMGLKVVPTATDTDEKLELVKRCIKNRAEGVMIKRRDGKYHPGARTNDCLKGKFTKTADLVVSAKGIGGKENLTLCAWDGTKLVEVGRCSAIGKPHCDVGDVIEVKYLYLGANNKLVQPTMLKTRPDKTMKQCEFAQLKATNKDVLV